MSTNVVIALLLLAAPLASQCEQPPLEAADGLGGDTFGNNVALRGNRALVTSIYDDGVGIDSGSAYVYELQAGGWVQAAKLVASDAAFDDRFGHAGSIFGDTAVVTSRYNQDLGYGTGSAYVFDRLGGSWTQTAYLVAPNLQSGALFGQSCDLGDGVIVVGASIEDGPLMNQGAVHVFHKSSGVWSETQRLVASDAKINTIFGESLDLDGNRLIVGARATGGTPSGAGAVYVFESVGGVWTQKQKLTAPQPQTGALFGEYVGISGNVIAVAAPLEDSLATDVGAVYVFEHNGTSWVQTAKLLPNAPGAWKFGPLDVSPDMIVVGAPSDAIHGADSGAVYRFHKQDGVWKQTGKFAASDTHASDFFGTSVSLSGDNVLVGAQGSKNDSAIPTGKAYFFGEMSAIVPYGAGVPGTGGVTPKLTLSGCTEAGGTLHVAITNAQPGAQAVIFLGLNKVTLPLLGCTLLTFPLLPLQVVLPLDASGGIALDTLIPASLVGPVTIELQGFTTDAGGPKGYSCTAGTQLTLGG